MDDILKISVDSWGITLSSNPIYFNLSWGFIIIAVGFMVARKILKMKRG